MSWYMVYDTITGALQSSGSSVADAATLKAKGLSVLALDAPPDAGSGWDAGARSVVPMAVAASALSTGTLVDVVALYTAWGMWHDTRVEAEARSTDAGTVKTIAGHEDAAWAAYLAALS